MPTLGTPAGLAFACLGLIWGSNFIFMKWAAALIIPLAGEPLRVLDVVAMLAIFAGV